MVNTDANEAKYQYIITNLEKGSLSNLEDTKVFIEYSNIMQDVYEIIEEYNLNRKCNVLIIFNDMIVDIITNKKT